MKNYFIISIILLSILSLSACETTEGFGRDVEKLGSEIEEAADK